MTDEFTGSGLPLNQDAIDAALAMTGAEPAALWAVLSVETSACGFLSDRRPDILFERHVFSKLTGGEFDQSDPDVSAPTPGGYGHGGAHQYDRLHVALTLDRIAALKSASWGLGQIMGGNCAAAGYADVETMVQDFVRSESAQLMGMARFLVKQSIASALAQKNWTRFARVYNGPNYAANNYDQRLSDAYGRYSAAGTPDLGVRRAQVLLNYRGAGLSVDGVMGPATRAAIKAFQSEAGLDPTGDADPDTLDGLEKA